jgi:transcriptional regulator GlxA family with amidase domain
MNRSVDLPGESACLRRETNFFVRDSIDVPPSPIQVSLPTDFIPKTLLWWEQAEAAQFKATRLAQIRGVSLRQLQRQFKRALGYSPQKWLDQLRITIAKQRLEAGGASIKGISSDLGFRHPSHFCRCFKAFNNLTPSQYVLVHRQNDVALVL